MQLKSGYMHAMKISLLHTDVLPLKARMDIAIEAQSERFPKKQKKIELRANTFD